MPRLHHSSDCSTVSTFCTDNDLGSRVYNGIYRFSCYLTSTELEGDIGLTMSACCPSRFWIFCAFADKLMIMGLHRPDKLLVTLCPSLAISRPLIGRSFSAHWDKIIASLPSPGGAYLDLVGGGHSAPVYLLFVAVYWFLGRQGYFGVSNVALVRTCCPVTIGSIRFLPVQCPTPKSHIVIMNCLLFIVGVLMGFGTFAYV